MASWQSKLLKPLLRNTVRKKSLTRPIEQERAALEALAARLPKPRDVQYEYIEVAGMPAERIQVPGATMQDTILNLHGGAYVLGSFTVDRVLTARLAHLTGKRVLTPNYRLAPEHPFPAAVDDALCAYRWILDQGVEPSRIVVTGTSAGGGLTVALLLATRDAGGPLPAAAVCLSPVFDLARTGESVKTNVELDVTLRPDMLEYMENAYLRTTDPKTPLASPLYADLHGLPPLLLHVGTDELLLDDSVRFAKRAQEAGIEVELSVWESMFHAWHAFAFFLPEGRRAMEEVGEFVRVHLP